MWVYFSIGNRKCDLFVLFCNLWKPIDVDIKSVSRKPQNKYFSQAFALIFRNDIFVSIVNQSITWDVFKNQFPQRKLDYPVIEAVQIAAY